MSDQDVLRSDDAGVNGGSSADAASAAAGNGQAADKPVSWQDYEIAQSQAKQYMEGWQRERAEFANYRKRTERERIDTYQNASADVLKNLLPIIDDFERGFASVPAELRDHPWVSGMTMVARKFDRLLEQFNVSAIDPTGKAFDPELHEAVMMEDSDDVTSGHVIETLQRGYLVGERVLRPALVKVAR